MSSPSAGHSPTTPPPPPAYPGSGGTGNQEQENSGERPDGNGGPLANFHSGLRDALDSGVGGAAMPQSRQQLPPSGRKLSSCRTPKQNEMTPSRFPRVGVEGVTPIRSLVEQRESLGYMSTNGKPKGDKEKTHVAEINFAKEQIVEAARKSAMWLTVGSTKWHTADRFLKQCLDMKPPAEYTLKKNNMTAEEFHAAKLKKIELELEKDPSIASCRSINAAARPMDGWTPLHAAASVGHNDAIEILLKSGHCSAWDVDLQGRTPLALAAEAQHRRTCALLRKYMKESARHDVVGAHAPVDLVGRTPLGWLSKGAAHTEIADELYARGDPCIFPEVSLEGRCGGNWEGSLLYGFADAPGFRADMEDAICAHSPLPDEPRLTGLFGVFDGHGGDFSSDFVSRHLAEYLVSSDAWKERDASPSLVRRALEDAFVKVDTALASQERMWVVEDPQSKDGRRYKAVDSSGSTGVVALVTESHVLVANAGDSRAILIHVMPSENGPPRIELEAMSQDHTAALTAERARIEAAGGIVDEQKYSEGDKECIGFRIRYDADVQGQSVAPSRGFGDFYYKQRRHLQAHEQVLTAFPEVRVTSRPPCDEEAYLLLACDGLWDVLTSKDAAELLVKQLHLKDSSEYPPGGAIAEACEDLIQEALARRSMDNITVLAVSLKGEVTSPLPTARQLYAD